MRISGVKYDVAIGLSCPVLSWLPLATGNVFTTVNADIPSKCSLSNTDARWTSITLVCAFLVSQSWPCRGWKSLIKSTFSSIHSLFLFFRFQGWTNRSPNQTNQNPWSGLRLQIMRTRNFDPPSALIGTWQQKRNVILTCSTKHPCCSTTQKQGSPQASAVISFTWHSRGSVFRQCRFCNQIFPAKIRAPK